MYQASAAFHAAAMAEEAAVLLLQFAGGTFLTTEDVGSIEVTYPLNEETDVTVGKCVSAELRCTVRNYHGLLSGFAFGKCAAALGAPVGADEWTMPACRAAVVHGYGASSAVTISAHEDAPFLRVNGSAASSQPTFAPSCLVIVNNTLYAGDGTNLWAATISGSALTAKAVDNDFLAYKLGRWSGRGISYQGKMAYEFTSGGVDKYEYVPLGTFYFSTPEQRRVANISCEALDGMQKFNVDVSNWWYLMDYYNEWPMTRGRLLAKLCAHVGVTLKTTTFPGSAVVIEKSPIAGNGITGKDVLGWIAESAATYARMSRDDQLELVWFKNQSVTLAQNQHFGDSPAEYKTPSIDGIHAMVDSSDIGALYPESAAIGDNLYEVLGNPLFYGATEDEIREKVQYMDLLQYFPAYTPNSVDAVCDWSIEPGDIIQVVGGDGTTRKLPIFRMVLKWAGGWARATYECTGGKGRKPSPQSVRREFRAYRAYHKLEVDIEGIHSEIGDVKGNVTNLEATAEGLRTRVSTVEGNVATLEITASELSSRIEGKIDGNQAQSLIDQTVDKISLEVSSDSTGSTFVIKKDGVEISSDKVDLHVNALNVDGEIVATSINLSTANITGTLSAQFIDATDLHVNGANIDNLTVTNAMIDTLYASKIVGGSVGGYVASGAISDASHYLSNLYATNAAFNAADIVTLNLGLRKTTVLTDLYVTTSAGSRSWESIVAGDSSGTAVFG